MRDSVRISGTTRLIAHLGYPTHSFKAPLIYNPYFAHHNIDAVVVPMGCRADGLAALLPELAALSNFLGCLVTMPHKVSVVPLLTDQSTTVRITQSCNAVKLNPEGGLVGDMFDGDGFVRGVQRKGHQLTGSRALVIGCGGVGSAIAASLARAGIGELGLQESNVSVMHALAARLLEHYPAISVTPGATGPTGWDLIVNATPLGMKPSDPLPMNLDGVSPRTLVGDVVLTREMTPFLQQAALSGCTVQVGTDMLFEQIPAYLEFFGLRSTTADELRTIARL